ncbi:hypothetical protein SO802_006395 [Lithocarpus litseifolius]|uniref:Uncharacterized protein n=1 Tax=Lithocarpus litseifolius TaxID=425828 RepID=A0AAW2DKR5_9ROSI
MPIGNSGSHVFTKDGFRNWKKVNDGNNCSILNHMGKEPNSFHRAFEQAITDLMKYQHIQRLSFIVNVVGASCKRIEQLKKAYADQIAYFVEIGELETGRGLNQINTLQ